MRYDITTKPEEVGHTPNVVEGFVGDSPFFFRARHGSWRLEVGDAIVSSGEGERLGKFGEEPGWWEGEDALEFCRQQIEAYIKRVAD